MGSLILTALFIAGAVGTPPGWNVVNDFGFESNLLSIIIALFQFPAAAVMFVNSSLHVFVLHLKTTRCGDFLNFFLYKAIFC